MQTLSPAREAVPDMPNRLDMAGIEFIEYATTRPQAFGQVLEALGFMPVARHRSREIALYRQGGMNLVVNAHPEDARVAATANGQPVLSAVAFRVRDALKAHSRCLALGAWGVPSHAQAMELQSMMEVFTLAGQGRTVSRPAKKAPAKQRPAKAAVPDDVDERQFKQF